MPEYTYHDFLETLNSAGRSVAEALQNHIAESHAEYKAYGILPKDKTKKEWSLHFRKYPKHGKPLCSLFSNEGVLSIRFMFYSSMAHEVLLRQEEFGEQVRAGILQACRCKGCGDHGDKEHCWCQRHYYINDKLCYSCNTVWYTIESITEGRLSDRDIEDVLYLSDLQSKHMLHSAKESRGAMHEEENRLRCGEVEIVKLEKAALGIDVFDPADHADVKRLDKYTSEYNLTPMGENSGLWFYFDERAACGKPNEGYLITTMPDGKYAMITIAKPFAFSVIRAWDYICLWLRKNNMTVNPVDIGGVKTPMFVKLFKQGGNQFAEIYVPVESASNAKI